MSVNNKIKAALNGIAPVQAGEYEPDQDRAVDTYIVINYNSNPADFGDDEPAHEVFSVQVHLYCPGGVNSLSMRREIKAALAGSGFSWPAYVDASDRDGQHHVFECMIAAGVGVE